MKLTVFQKAIFAIILANIIWGATPPIFKWSLTDMQPFTFGFLRFMLATYILLPFAWKTLRIRKEDLFSICALSFVGILLHIGTFLVGLQFAPSINVPIIGSAGPIFLIIGSAFFLGEKPKPKVIIGTCISLIGVLLIIIRTVFEGQTSGSIFGNMLFLLSTISSIIHLLLLKRFIHKYNAVTITFWTFLIGALLFAPFMFFEIQQVSLVSQIDNKAVFGIIFGAVFASVIAWVLLTYAVKQIPANEVGIFSYIDPIITALVALPLLGETITFTYLLGALFVFVGIFIAEERLQYHPIQKLP